MVYWLTLNRVDGVGPATFLRLLDFFGSPREVLKAKQDDLLQVSGLRPPIAQAIASAKEDFTWAEKELNEVERLHAGIIPYVSPDYPRRLKQISAPPPFLYVWGSLANGAGKASRFGPAPKGPLGAGFNSLDWLGVVGARECSEYGVSVCAKMVREVVSAGVGIVSGFARGIDITAHETAVHCGGKTVAVLGSGLNFIYPPRNARFVDAVLEKGAFVTEFALDEEARPEFFPRRNRIISGMARGVLVVEAGEKSGSLITAQYALEQDRDVYAAPGSVLTPFARGSNRLIQQGAKLVGSAKEILDDWKYETPAGPVPPEGLVSPVKFGDEETIVRLCVDQPATPDDLVERTGLPPARVTMLLTQLELEGRIRSLPGRRYQSQ